MEIVLYGKCCEETHRTALAPLQKVLQHCLRLHQKCFIHVSDSYMFQAKKEAFGKVVVFSPKHLAKALLTTIESKILKQIRQGYFETEFRKIHTLTDDPFISGIIVRSPGRIQNFFESYSIERASSPSYSIIDSNQWRRANH